jgi:tubulinyl-Tyr carboxypeptidase
MYSFAKELQANATDEIEKLEELKDSIEEYPPLTPPFSHLCNSRLSNAQKCEKMQEYINKLQYNHTGMQFFDIAKNRPLAGLMEVAKKMIDESLPIKCLEAVILSIYLTNEISSLEKFTIGFKTSSNRNIHRHVVLGVYDHSTGFFGCLGTSRRSDLAYKPLKYKTLSELIQDYISTYMIYLHKVKRVRIGLPINNSNRSYESIPWNGCTIYPCSNSDWEKLVEKHSRNIRIYNTHSNSTEIKQTIRTSYDYSQHQKENRLMIDEFLPPNKPKNVASLLNKNTNLLPKRRMKSLRV